jgi:hypothetical protein
VLRHSLFFGLSAETGSGTKKQMARRVLRIFGSRPRFQSNEPPEDEVVTQHSPGLFTGSLVFRLGPIFDAGNDGRSADLSPK